MADQVTGILSSESNKQQNAALANLRAQQDQMKQMYQQSMAQQQQNVAPAYAPGYQALLDTGSSAIAGASAGTAGALFNAQKGFEDQRAQEAQSRNDLLNRGLDYQGKSLDISKNQYDQQVQDQQSVENEVAKIAGNDPRAYQKIMSSIESDPEMAGSHNAVMMAMKHAQMNGIDPFKIQLGQERQKLQQELALKAAYEKNLLGAKAALEKKGGMTPQQQLAILNLGKGGGSGPSVLDQMPFGQAIKGGMNLLGYGEDDQDKKRAALVNIGAIKPEDKVSGDLINELFNQKLTAVGGNPNHAPQGHTQVGRFKVTAA